MICFCQCQVCVMSFLVAVAILLLLFVVPCHGCKCVVYDFPEDLCSISKSYGESKCQSIELKSYAIDYCEY